MRRIWGLMFIMVYGIGLYGSEKYVIGCYSPQGGLFSNFFSVLNHLQWCAKNNKIPVVQWGKECLYYQPQGYNGSFNVWEYYFEVVSYLSAMPSDVIHKSFRPSDYSGMKPFSFNCSEMIKAKVWVPAVMKKYIRIKPSIYNKAVLFYEKYMKGKKTVGLHLRGTDKAQEVPITPLELIIDEANKNQDCQFFVATDDQRLLKRAQQLLKGNVIYYTSVRSLDGKPLHMTKRINKAQLGEDVLIEVLLLTKCTTFIHTCSNVSMAVHFFNPSIESLYFYPHTHKKYLIQGTSLKEY